MGTFAIGSQNERDEEKQEYQATQAAKSILYFCILAFLYFHISKQPRLPKVIHKFLQSELTQKIYLSTILTHLMFNFTIENGDEKAKKLFVSNSQRENWF